MPQHYVPRDVLMCNRHNVQLCTRSFLHETVNYGDADGAKARLVAEAKANVECPIASLSPERLQHNLCRIRDRIVACQFADTRAINCANRWQHVKVNGASETIAMGPRRPLPLLLSSLRLTHSAIPTLAERRDHRLDWEKQRSTVLWIFDKLGTFLIEAFRRIVLGVDKHRPDADTLRGYGDAAQRVR